MDDRPDASPVDAAAVRQERLPARDAVDEVAPGVGRIQLPIMLPGLGHVNCYVLEDERGVALVDPGLPGPSTNQVLVERLRSVGIPPERVHTVIVTHSHPDHFGGAGRLRVEHGAVVVAHRHFRTPFDIPFEDDLAELEAATDGITDEAAPDDLDPGHTSGRSDRLERVLFGDGPIPAIPPRPTPWGEDGFRPAPEELEVMRSWDDLSKQGLLQLDPTRRVDDLEWIRLGRRDWQVIHTPGHTGDHICLLDPTDGTFLSGDHVLPTITPHISGLTGSTDSLADFVAALRRVAALPGVTRVLPAHGLPFDDLGARVEDIIAHHEVRLAQLERIGDELGDATVRQYSRRLFQERSWGPMAESETYAHLEHLRIEGRMASRVGDDGLLRFRPVG
jgi:glyoxylase-like metal-dependent hydrolase (beta-lactamase superfamily II)